MCFADDLRPEELAAKAADARSTLMAFFKYNTEHTDSRTLLYHQFPEEYTWKPKERAWQKRKRGYCIGRIYHCSPVSGERYYLRLLLTAVPGPRSFDELYIVDGVCHLTYYVACIARGLAENDQEWF